jgi:hypothetical protein
VVRPSEDDGAEPRTAGDGLEAAGPVDERDPTGPADVEDVPERDGNLASFAGGADAARYIVDVFRGLVEDEFRAAERVSATARQAFTVAAGLLAVAQSVAFGSFRVGQITLLGRVALVASALTAIVLLIIAGIATFKVDSDDKREESAVNPELLTWLMNRLDREAPGSVMADLADGYRQVLDSRRAGNSKRARDRSTARRWVVRTLLATTVELTIALLVRL